jgi:hypothetical protein
MVTCVFCGLYRLGSEEDVVSKWIQGILDTGSEITIRVGSSGETGPAGRTVRANHLVVTVRDMVCRQCNNDWMSQLENRVKSFLVPALTHEREIALDQLQQRDLAKWAVMKVLLIEHSSRQFRAHLRTQTGYLATEAELAWLCKHDGPPPRSRIWIAGFDAEHRYAVTIQSRLGTWPQALDGGSPIPAHLTTLTLGYTLLQVATTDFVLADARSLPDFPLDPPWPYSEALSRIWPRRHPILRWPAGLPVAPNVLDKVANWGLPSVSGAPLV